MSLEISVTVLLFIGEVLETKLVWGALGHDFDLDSAGFQMNAKIDHIRWEKGKTKVAELKTGILKDTHGKYNISTNGFLKIKHLMMNDSDIYKVAIYDKDGKSVLRRNYQLKIQGKSHSLNSSISVWALLSKLGNNIYGMAPACPWPGWGSPKGELMHLSHLREGSSPVEEMESPHGEIHGQ